MVKVRDDYPTDEQGQLDVMAWVGRLEHLNPKETLPAIEKAVALADSDMAAGLTEFGESSFEQGLAMAEVVASLHVDAPTMLASIIFPSFVYGNLSIETIHTELGEDVASLVIGADKMNALSGIGSRQRTTLQDGAQLDKLRKMILAMVEDIRVVLIKLADHLCSLRMVKNATEAERCEMAAVAQDIFAPLANRLGVGQIKWELEDLSFRYLHPATYKRIAKLLDERRVDRERYIKRVISTIEDALTSDDIKAEVHGRVKHIFSIWRKMHRKNIDYDQVYDVRAVRILVPNIQACYSALGTVHRLWHHIHKEFDDYIATPKENGYRSLHTAVSGPEGKTLEIQIRTFEMHQESELGVAAHWRYKEGGGHDATFEQKLAWLRQLLDWQEEWSSAGEVIDDLKSNVGEQRVYVLTPKGDVIDLPTGATPLDFAYTIHTSIGHRCRGAKVNGRIVQLTYQLKTGERVEVISGPVENPSRDWLNANLGYIKSARSRGKIQQWFKQQDKDKNAQQGRAIMERELQRLGVGPIDFSAIAKKLNVTTAEDVLAGVCTGDIRLQQVLNAAEIEIADKNNEAVIPFTSLRKSVPRRPEEITIQGVSNLLTTLAQCCRPLPGDPIIGYITQGKGITIHRNDCNNITQVSEERRARLIDVEWGNGEKTYPVDICVEAYDRSNLLRDITNCLANESVNVITLNLNTDKSSGMTQTYLTIEITDLVRLTKIMDKLSGLQNVIKVRRQA